MLRRLFIRTGCTAALLALRLGAAVAGQTEAADAPAAAGHPLDPLTALEYRTVARALSEAGHTDESSRFPTITLAEPDKDEVLRWKRGEPASRRAFVVVKQGRRTFEAEIDLTRQRVVSWNEARGVQPGILLSEEWSAAGEMVRADPAWREAIRKRGIEDFERVLPVPLTVGNFGDPRESDERLVKVLSFDTRDTGNYWGRPIEGVIALVSLDQRRVLEVVDTGVVPIPRGPVDLDEASVGPARTPPGPVSIGQPGGPGFELDGHLVRWQKWSFHWRVDPRLGLVLSLVRYGADGGGRSILYQGSLSEMFVPYTDPAAGWYFRAYMDAGEYGIGKLSSRLEPGLDCPVYATFFHPLFADEWGNAYQQERAACLFERYAGDVAWRHHEAVTGRGEARRRTELVFRQVPAVGNYDYVVDWIFRQDGSLHVSVGATGVPQVRAVALRSLAGDEPPPAHGRLVAEHTAAIHHDHFFCFRLDLDVDGRENSLLVERLKTVRLDDGGPRQTTWIVEGETAPTELAARLRIDLERPALWRVVNPEVRGPRGYPVSYQLVPGRNAVPLLAPDDPLQRRAGFTDYHLWVTPYRSQERYAAGAYPNQSPGGDGLPRWVSQDRPIEGTDVVLWYTLGMHHVVRTEDWPVLPTTARSFELRPFDFFDRNPALDIPKSP